MEAPLAANSGTEAEGCETLLFGIKNNSAFKPGPMLLDTSVARKEAPPTPPKNQWLFSPDNILNLVDYRLPRVTREQHGRHIFTSHILSKVNEAYGVVKKEYNDACEDFLKAKALEAGSSPRLDSQLVHLRLLKEKMTEAWLCAKYFNYMLIDLEQSKSGGDMLIMAVPDTAAPLAPWICESSGLPRHSAERTYHSRIPALLRSIPLVMPPIPPSATLPDLCAGLSNMNLATGESSM
ncbi:hypothetical protein HWV62_13643 [Athelia sp. TMB]|nr:hypothetical protein HWV62_13643 [Athelia sp. TMB]